MATTRQSTDTPSAAATGAWRPQLATTSGRRAVLAAAIVIGITAAALLGRPNPAILAEPDLAAVLRLMGAIKLAIAAGVAALVWSRAAGATTPGRYTAYVAATALLATTGTLVVKLAVVLLTSVVFHATLLSLGLLALGDTRLAKGALKRR
jgi:hypothetical protein